MNAANEIDRLGMESEIAMNPDDEIAVYREVLENGLNMLCDAVGVYIEYYDSDQSDFSCYEDCFKDMALLLRELGVYFDRDDCSFKRHPMPRRA